MDITLRQVEAFVAVATECHFGRAAAVLNVSQPVISQEIQRLERTIGAPLFDRSTRTVRLTAAGEALLDEAREVHARASAFAARAKRMSTQRFCRLRIAGTPSVMDQFLPAALRRAETAMPDAVLDEVAVETGEIPRALLELGCDVGIGRFIDPPPGFSVETIRCEPLLVALSARHPMAASPAADLAELGDLPLLLWPREQNPAYHDHLMQICRAAGLEPLLLISPPRIVGGRSYLIADARAFSLIPASSAARMTGDTVVLPLRVPATVPLSMAWRTRDQRPVLADLLDVLRATGPRSELRE